MGRLDDEAFKHMDLLTANIANDVTNSKFKCSANKKEDIDRCAAVAGIREDGYNEGRLEGILIDKQKVPDQRIAQGILTPEQAAQF